MYVSSCNVKQTISLLNYPSSKFTVSAVSISELVGNFNSGLAAGYHCHTNSRLHTAKNKANTNLGLLPVSRSLCGFFSRAQAGEFGHSGGPQVVAKPPGCCGCHMWIRLELDHDKYVPEQENMGTKL